MCWLCSALRWGFRWKAPWFRSIVTRGVEFRRVGHLLKVNTWAPLSPGCHRDVTLCWSDRDRAPSVPLRGDTRRCRQRHRTRRWVCELHRLPCLPDCGERTPVFIFSSVSSGVFSSWLFNSDFYLPTLLQLLQGSRFSWYGFDVAYFYSVEQFWMFHCRDQYCKETAPCRSVLLFFLILLHKTRRWRAGWGRLCCWEQRYSR